ncbi:PREDICTED: NRR repressor homolog 1-like [Ipomoea nil]|uniref:NRR repressor homolog 1-like n=1 Tax=Ipomoea nil TaxID=35883 RepID=UPI0009015FB2|nr:PREDICTED: NRR repressor homolog 1-like [Ipomoea nil]XP_019165033.1 PREDICTED: NRR repressor homolog 1-like [Ipomoea nil]
MGVEKRKRLIDGEVPGKKARAAAAEEDEKTNNPAPEEEEVEEFFAILRRIQVAVKYFGKVNGESGGGGRKAAAVRPWNPSFRREDFEERAEPPETTVMMENTNTGLDLNSEPDCQPTSPDKKPV